VPSGSNKKQGKTGTSDSSTEIRHVHPTYVGYVCPVHSPEGQETGLIKQLAITAIISKESDSFKLIDQILECEHIKKIETVDVNTHDNTKYVCLVYVNGVLVGYTDLTIIEL
jgi:DNA-directed RNA polymerase subunit B